MPQGNRFHTKMKDITLSVSACISLVSLALVPRGTHVKHRLRSSALASDKLCTLLVCVQVYFRSCDIFVFALMFHSEIHLLCF